MKSNNLTHSLSFFVISILISILLYETMKVYDISLIKQQFINRINYTMPRPNSILLIGMLIGEAGSLSYEFKQNLQKTGVIHTIVVSGSNLSMLSNLLLSLSIIKALNRGLKLLVLLFLLFIYVVFVGVEPPILRAYLMASIFLFGKIYGRVMISIWAFCISLFLMLLFKPIWINDISFQLSSAATLGMLLFDNSFKLSLNTFIKSFKSLSNNKLIKICVNNLSSTLAANMFVWTIISYYFNQISLIAPLVNVLILWTIPIIMLSGLFCLILSFIYYPASELVLYALFWLLEYFIYVVNYFASFAYASINFSVSLDFLISYFIILILFYLRVSKSYQND